tara:strand:+ start:287 stop:676 length:390 start_codon:yes stop_codon:yes gene_type:complete
MKSYNNYIEKNIFISYTMNFQLIVILIATILLIVALVFIGYALYNHRFSKQFPPVIAECPDFWVAEKDKCTNPKNLGNCKGAMNFNNPRFKGHDSDCSKAKWANSCNVSWSGITNNPNVCKGVNNNTNN